MPSSRCCGSPRTVVERAYMPPLLSGWRRDPGGIAASATLLAPAGPWQRSWQRPRRSSVRGAGLHEARLVGEDDGLRAVAEVELGEQPGDVGLYGRVPDHEAVGDLGVRQSGGQQAQ